MTDTIRERAPANINRREAIRRAALLAGVAIAPDWLDFAAQIYPIYGVFAVLREDADATGPRALLGEDGWFFNTAFVPGESTLWDPAGVGARIRDGQTWLNGAAIDGTMTPRPKQMSVLSVVTSGGPVQADRLFQHSGLWFWKGDIAELVLYDRPLTATERKAIVTGIRALRRLLDKQH